VSYKEHFEAEKAYAKERHYAWFLPFYEKLGWVVADDHTEDDYFPDFDIEVDTEDTSLTIEEKSNRGIHPNLFAEVLQNMNEIDSLGWLLTTKADVVFYVMFEGDTIIAYWVNPAMLRALFPHLKTDMRISGKGGFPTLYTHIPWGVLEEYDIAERQELDI
jgi:hypothetical protein